MHRFSKIIFVVCALLPYSACTVPRVAGSDTSGVRPFVGTVAGNEIGGVVPLLGNTKEQALKMAQTHCSQYGRSARMLSIRNEEGGKVVFECY
jgi:hypothetical protein